MYKVYTVNGRCWKSDISQRKLLRKAFQHFWDVGVFYFVDTDSEQFCKYIMYRKPRGDFWRIVDRGFIRSEFPFR